MNEKGGVALLTIGVLVSLIGIMAYTMNRTSGMSSIMEHGNKGNEEAYYIAEAGIQNALWEIKQVSTWTAGFINKPFGSGTYTVTATDVGGNTTSLVSTGTSGNSKKTIQARITTSSCAPTTAVFTNADDNFMVSGSSGKWLNKGNKLFLNVKGAPTPKKRSLIYFDISTLPGTAVVSSATLELYLYSSGSSNNVKIFRVTNQWTELGSSWKRRMAGINWSPAGGEFNPTVEGLLPSGSPGAKQATITTLVQSWINGTANYGMLLKYGASQNKYRSSEYSIVSERPKLTVNYTPC